MKRGKRHSRKKTRSPGGRRRLQDPVGKEEPGCDISPDLSSSLGSWLVSPRELLGPGTMQEWQRSCRGRVLGQPLGTTRGTQHVGTVWKGLVPPHPCSAAVDTVLRCCFA